MKRAQQILMALVAAAIGVSSNDWACPPRYSVEVISGPSCGTSQAAVFGTSMNDQGDACGYIECAGGLGHAFVSINAGPPSLLSFPLGTDSSHATAINDKGVIVGDFSSPADPEFGYLGFVRDGDEFTTIFPPKGGNWVECYGINSNNVVVGGQSDTDPGVFPLAFWWKDGVTHNINSDMPLKGTSIAYAINDAGQITGWMGETAFPYNYHAFLWDNGKVIDIGLPFPDCFATEGRAINSKGQVAGVWFKSIPGNPGFVRRAFFWDGSQAIDIGTLYDSPAVTALGVDDSGTVVGAVGSGGFYAQGLLWQDGVSYDLNLLTPPPSQTGVHINVAVSINSEGQILANGAFTQGVAGQVTIRLTPIPPLVGDATCDDAVNIDDILAVVNGWGPCPNKAPCSPDLNDDLNVNVLDLMTVIEHWQ